jgi:acetolactate decarboxylase
MKSGEHYGIVFLFALLLIGCRTGRNEDKQGKVFFSGDPEQVMAGNFDLKIDIDSLVGKKNSYAFGVLDSLDGMFQLFDGTPEYSILEGDSVVVKKNLKRQAAFLVHCQNTEWQQIALPASVANTEALVGFLEYNETLKLDTDLPFVFLIEGIVEQLDWHIVPELLIKSDSLISDQTKQLGTGTIDNKYIEIIGLYAPEHIVGFTSKNIPIHMHFKTADGTLSGHVDHLELGAEMSLRIPKTY